MSNKDPKDTDQHPNMNFENEIYSTNRLDMNMVVMYGGINPRPYGPVIDDPTWIPAPSIDEVKSVDPLPVQEPTLLQGVFEALAEAIKNKDNKVLFKYWMITASNRLNDELKNHNISKNDFEAIKNLLK